jgi:subtilisin family serine protease
MNSSQPRPRNLVRVAGAFALGMALTIAGFAAAQAQFRGGGMGGGMGGMGGGSRVPATRVPGGTEPGGGGWRPPIRIPSGPIDPGYDAGPYDDVEVRIPVRRPRPVDVVEDDEPAPGKPPRRVKPPRHAVSPRPTKQVSVKAAKQVVPAKPARKVTKIVPPKPMKAARVPPPVPRPVVARPRPTVIAAPAEMRLVPDEVLFEVPDGSGGDPAGAVARRHKLVRVSSERFALLGSTIHRYRIPDRRAVADVVRELQADRRVASVQPNFKFRLQAEAGRGTLNGAQYALARMHVADAHRLATGERVIVAVIDSGIDGTHRELAGALADTLDVVGGSAKPEAHGTGIAGIIGARAQLTGVAPGAKLLAIRAFKGDAGKPGAEGTTYHVLRALDAAHQGGARVVNMSFAGPQDQLLSRALRAGRDKGMVFVAAVGNEGPAAKPLYPAADESVIAVTASDKADRIYPAANRGAYICITAPGVDVMTPAPGGAYGFSSGTSLAAAHVSGAIALMLQSRPSLGPDEVRAILTATAQDLGAPGSDPEFGAGFADALAMVARAAGEPAFAPLAPALEAVVPAPAPEEKHAVSLARDGASPQPQAASEPEPSTR